MAVRQKRKVAVTELGRYTPSEKPSVQWYETADQNTVHIGGIKWQNRYSVVIPFADVTVAQEVLSRLPEMLQCLNKPIDPNAWAFERGLEST